MRISILIVSVLSLFGCAKQPSCDGSDVKELVFDIMRDELKKQLKTAYLMEKHPMIQQYAMQEGVDFPQAWAYLATGTSDAAEIAAAAEAEASEYASTKIKEAILKLNAPKITGIDEKLKKCTCAAELIVEIDKKVTTNIMYTAHYTEDNQLYVEAAFQE